MASKAKVPIATGESLTMAHEFERLLRAGGAHVVQPDAAQIGITQFLEVIDLAEVHGVQVIPHGPWHGITVAAHAHLLTGVEHAPMIEYPAWRTWPADSPAMRVAHLAHQELVEVPVEVRDGQIKLSDRPGLGLGHLRAEAIEAFERLSREVTV